MGIFVECRIVAHPCCLVHPHCMSWGHWRCQWRDAEVSGGRASHWQPPAAKTHCLVAPGEGMGREGRKRAVRVSVGAEGRPAHSLKVHPSQNARGGAVVQRQSLRFASRRPPGFNPWHRQPKWPGGRCPLLFSS